MKNENIYHKAPKPHNLNPKNTSTKYILFSESNVL